MRTLLWFRRNLRVHDQPLFRVDEAAVGVWILDPREIMATDPAGFPRCGTHRLRFLLESVADLRSRLRALGSELIVRVGEPETVLAELAQHLEVATVRTIEEPGTEERTTERAVAKALPDECVFERMPPETLFEFDDPHEVSRELPEVFSKFRRTSEKREHIGVPLPTPTGLNTFPIDAPPGDIPTLQDLGHEDHAPNPNGVMTFQGGETAGLSRVEDWIFTGDHLQRYKETRNGLVGADYSSKFSPWLALGCISSRQVAAETLRYEAERVANDSTYWLRFELIWREYFRLYLLKHGPRLFRRGGPQNRDLGWANPAGHFEAWCAGETGEPFVDANMIELKETGFMSNRGRQNVASFLTKNLDVDWRLGARWFESNLMDYCPAANWGNWAYAAGVGADPRGFRGFDVQKQARNYDPNREFVGRWFNRASQNQPLVDPRISLTNAEARWEAISNQSKIVP